MAKIQVDFDEVMLFGGLHRDIASSLRAHTAVFSNTPGVRLDQVIDAFGLTRVSPNEHFQGQTLEWSLDDARARADRVAKSIHETSTRIFRQASPIDDHFDWPVLLLHSIGAGLSAGPGAALLELAGGEIVGFVAGKVAVGALATPALVVVAPVFLLVTGGLALYDGTMQIVNAAGDAWEYVAGGLKLVAGVTASAVAVDAAVFLLGLGAASAGAFLATPLVVGALAVGAIAGTAALAIDNRAAIGRVLGFETTTTEQTSNLLNLSGGTVAVLAGGHSTTIKQFDNSSTGDLLTKGLLQGPHIVLQAAAPGQDSTDLFARPAQTEVPSPIAPAPSVASSPVGPAEGEPGATSGALPPSGGSDAYSAGAGFVYAPGAKYTPGPPANGYRDQWELAAWNCTSWAAFRRAQLGMSPPPQKHGGAMGLSAELSPTLGAIVAYGEGTEKDFGHVMIIEEVFNPDQFRVSELNWDEQGGFRDSLVWSRQSDMRWKSSRGTVKTLKFTP